MGLFRRKSTVDQAQLAAVLTEIAQLRGQLQQLGELIDASSGDQLDLRVSLVDLQHRVTAVGSELTNQLTELSGDIDALNARPNPTVQAAAALESAEAARAVAGAAREAADAVKAGQERLANEQARYQIAFRDDLAALADQLARKRQ
jgi:chromosome segregation ATPase